MSSPTWAQEKMWKENENKLIQALNKSSLTFKELIDNHELGLSRAVLNQHLKALEKQGIVKKEYKDGKLLNVLKISEFSMVDYFLSQLVALGVPKSIADKGKQLLSEDVLVFSALAFRILYAQMTEMTLYVTKRRPKDTRKVKKIFAELGPIPEHTPKLSLETQSLGTEAKPSDKHEIIAELNPYVLHIIMSEHGAEIGSTYANPKAHLVKQLVDVQPKGFKELLDRPFEWWFEEVCPYLPLSTFLTIFSGFFNVVNEEFFQRRMLLIKY